MSDPFLPGQATMRPANDAHIFYRISGGVMLVSALWNMLMSFVLFFSLIWVCVGVFWVIPGVLALACAGTGIYMLVTGDQVRPTAFAPGVGLLVSIMNFNCMAMGFDVLALILGAVGYSKSSANPDQIPMY